MINLTDEGLNKQAHDLALEVGVIDVRVPPSRQDDFKRMIASALQQVRDAAKKEEREKVRVLAWGLIKNDKLDTAIRQMDGGK